ncbi:hypothetical protein Aeqsu_0671 [Aequorivita sublithincola DSM 14238]|uniref:Uncharacterized protein n=1 Tax=Aequorivita sublithincola (strain DSM 14238 / LMG 21431 / ACAM 643 / 9-3) TaxID=746697 RepID=I3YT61_AEQSU|nr:hypothetical protein Aeqsu_0671 [Aequorivita sublithincola DSM 14238]
METVEQLETLNLKPFYERRNLAMGIDNCI